MTFEELLDQAIALLQRRGRLTYRALKRQFNLDDDYLEDLKAELIKVQRLAVDEDGEVLVWAGDTVSVVAAPALVQAQAPCTYTPQHLVDKILTSRSALEGERKQVTVLFADLKGSMELLADRDPEEARQILDPVLERMMAEVHRYEGTVNQVLGDGIMALFGAPIAHEDHAVRACYATLAMQDAIRRYSEDVRRTHGITVQMRVGLNSGEALSRAGTGHGQVVALVGEPGVGKSRLVYELVHAPHTQSWRVLESAAVSYGQATSYFPVIALLKRYAQVEECDDPRTIRAKLTGQVLTLDETLQDTLPAGLAASTTTTR